MFIERTTLLKKKSYLRSDRSKSHDYIDCMMNLKKWLATPPNKNCYYLQLFYERVDRIYHWCSELTPATWDVSNAL